MYQASIPVPTFRGLEREWRFIVQVQLLFPEQSRAAFGVVRAVVADSDDRSNIPTFLDSDGRYTDDSRRSGVGPRADPKASPDGGSVLTDGMWHMATITTLPTDTNGYR